MVALSSWIESEESAVADPFSRLDETATPSKNRVGDFFRETPNRVGETGLQVVDRVGFLLIVELRPRLAPSLARSEQEVLPEGEIIGSGEVTVTVRQPKPKGGRQQKAWRKRNNGYVGEATVSYNIRRAVVDGVEVTWASDFTVVDQTVFQLAPPAGFIGGPFSGMIGFKGVGVGFGPRLVVTTGNFAPVGNVKDGFNMYGKVNIEARIFAGVSIQPNVGGGEGRTYNPVVDTGLVVGRGSATIRF